MPVIAVGLITDYEQAEAIIGTGDADLVALARAHALRPHVGPGTLPPISASASGRRTMYLRCQPRQHRHLFDV